MTRKNNQNKSKNLTSGSGTATSGGVQYQAKVAGWFAVRILAQQLSTPILELPATITLQELRQETEHELDDLLVTTSENGSIYVQAKHGLDYSAKIGSDTEFVKCIKQCTRQYLGQATVVKESNKEVREIRQEKLDVQKDRFVIITDRSGSPTVQTTLARLLTKLREAAPSQGLEEGLLSEVERKLLSVLKNNISQLWEEYLKESDTIPKPPTNEEILDLLHFIHILVLNLDDSDTEDIGAQDVLRQTILHTPSQSGSAWSVITSHLEKSANLRGGVDRTKLVNLLLQNNFNLLAAPNYRSDIKKLQKYTEEQAKHLQKTAVIKFNLNNIKLPRTATKTLREAAEIDSLVVVGLPGAGKSTVLYQLVTDLINEKRNVVFLPIDKIELGNQSPLFSPDIPSLTLLPDILENWHSVDKQTSFLVIDALDSSRLQHNGRVWKELIEKILSLTNSSWKLVVSIRKYDLRYDHQLQRLFRLPLIQSEFQDNEFTSTQVRHIQIPRLSDEELVECSRQIPPLKPFINEVAYPELTELLRIPFNLKLVTELLESSGNGSILSILSPLRTQVELLNLYWEERVEKVAAGENILARISREMISNRRFQTARTELSLTSNLDIQALAELLSSNFLTDWQHHPGNSFDKSIIQFSHQIFFDYTVSRLYLKQIPQDLIKQLETEPNLILLIRPSIVFSLQRIWLLDSTRHYFWEAFAFPAMTAEKMPAIAKIASLQIVYNIANDVGEFDFLLNNLDPLHTTSSLKETAEKTLENLARAMLMQIETQTTNPSLVNGPWCDLWGAIVSRIPLANRMSLVNSIGSLLFVLTGDSQVALLTNQKKSQIGLVARTILDFMWKLENRNPAFTANVIKAVCRTFETDSSASEQLLVPCLNRNYFAQHGSIELYHLVPDLMRLVEINPSLVESLYIEAFSYKEISREATPLIPSRIFGLVSNKAQDYESFLNRLAQFFPHFLENAPVQATHTLIRVLEYYVNQEYIYSTSYSTKASAMFSFRNIDCRIREDHSRSWYETHSTRRYRDEPLKMLDAFKEYIKNTVLAQPALLERLLDVIAENNEWAAIWGCLMAIGAEEPDKFGMSILPLSWTLPILTCRDTREPAKNFILQIFNSLSEENRQRIELAILSIADEQN